MPKAKWYSISLQTVDCSNLYKIFESLSTEINTLSAQMSFDASNTSNTTISLSFSKNSTQSLFAPISPEPKVLLAAVPVQEAKEDVNLHPLVRGSIKVTDFTQSMESLMSKVVPAQLIFEPTVPK